METMEEKFEKWAEEKAYKWVEGFRKLRNEGKFLDDKGLRYVLMKAFRAGHAYSEDNAEE